MRPWPAHSYQSVERSERGVYDLGTKRLSVMNMAGSGPPINWHALALVCVAEYVRDSGGGPYRSL
jgi:hypothetical protein